MKNQKLTEYNSIVDYICHLNAFTLEELEEKLSSYLESLNIDYKKVESIINNIILQLVLNDRFKIEKNKFMNNYNNKTIGEKENQLLIKKLSNLGNDIYIEKEQPKYIKLRKNLLKKKCQ